MVIGPPEASSVSGSARVRSGLVCSQLLPSLVDRQMREVVEATQTADTLKVAILAALNIADDYLQARRGTEVPLDRQTDRWLARMVTLLDEALAG